jgi:hypothetical protein
LSEPKCINGCHNPDVTTHQESQCFKLYPEQRKHMEKHSAKGKKRAAKKAKVVEDTSSMPTAWHIVKKAHLNLGSNTTHLDSGALHHMVSDHKAFASYTVSLCDAKG